MYRFLDIPAFHEAAHADYPDMTLYCLADHGGMPGLHRELERAGIDWRSLFAGSSEENALEVAPLLFSVDEALQAGRRSLLGWVAEHGTYTSSMLVLASPLGIDQLTAALAQRLDAVVQDDIEVMLRFFDPRVFEALMPVLAEAGRETFLGIAACWWLLDRRGAVVAYPARLHDMDRFEAPLRFDEAQERTLVVASEPDQVASRLAEIVPAQLLEVPLPERHGFIVAQTSAAKGIGVSSLHELTLYCAAALLDGREFATSAKWRDAIVNVSDGKIGFIDAIGMVGA